MRIGSYNLFEGAHHATAELEAHVAQQELDILCIQEANDWYEGGPSRLELFAGNTGLSSFVFGDSNSRFKLATFSAYPIVESRVYKDKFWHSAVRTVIDTGSSELDIWNVHLNPMDESKRLLEVEYLLSLAGDDRETLVMGDFNSLSRRDGYSTELAGSLKKLGIKKFGDDELRFDVTDMFERRGFTDLGARLPIIESTVPTPANKDAHHAAALRLDYMFASGGIAHKATSFNVPKNELTDVISDHYPITVGFSEAMQ